ncbi:MAG: DUF362 domain-containing protein [Armatimonadota bacterium]|nr:DUF362 domain-containing protein [bacterium]
MKYPRCELPKFVKVRQYLPDEHIDDVQNHVVEQFKSSKVLSHLSEGKRVAISVGDRGIGHYHEILRGIIDAVKDVGAEPFLFNAIGSHGGATVEGQREVLTLHGITEESFGVPVKVTLDTVALGKAENGAEAHFNKDAYEADATIVVSQEAVHPVLTEDIASGLMKMVTIGCGAQAGPAWAHSHGLAESVRLVPKVTIPNSNIIAGVAVVSNGYNKPHTIEVVPPDKFEETDRRLLVLQKSLMKIIPFDHLHVLAIDMIGKSIAGSGMDPNVIGFWRIKGGPHTPDFRRIVVFDLTKESLGNGIGVGLADFTTKKLVGKFDWNACYTNLLTGRDPNGRLIEGQLPLALEDDREAMEVALYSALPEGSDEPRRIVRIHNTRNLDVMYVSEALIPEAVQDPSTTVLDEPREMPFDDSGNVIWEENNDADQTAED